MVGNFNPHQPADRYSAMIHWAVSPHECRRTPTERDLEVLINYFWYPPVRSACWGRAENDTNPRKLKQNKAHWLCGKPINCLHLASFCWKKAHFLFFIGHATPRSVCWWRRSHPANTTRRTDAGLMLVQRRRRWSNIKPTLVKKITATTIHCPYVGLMLGRRLRRSPNIGVQ